MKINGNVYSDAVRIQLLRTYTPEWTGQLMNGFMWQYKRIMNYKKGVPKCPARSISSK